MTRKTKQYTNPFIKSKGPSTSLIASITSKIQDAVALHQQGQLGLAEALYREIVRVEPDNAEALHLLGVIAHQTGNHQDAVDLISRAIATRPNAASYYSNRGIALQELKQLEAAAASHEQAIKLKPDFADAHYNKGNVLHELKQFEAAVESYDKAILLNPDNAKAYYNRANALEESKQLHAAVASYDRAIFLNPDYSDAHSNRGMALQELKQFEAAVASFDRVIRQKPESAEAYSNRGSALHELKQFVSAIASYDKAISLHPAFAAAYYNRGNALQELKQFDAAIASYDKAIELKPAFAEAYYNRGNALQELKQLDAAIASYDKGISHNPDYAEAYSNRGSALQELNQLDAAHASFNKAISLKPSYAEAYSNRGGALQELKQLDAAIESYDKAISLNPDYANAYGSKSLCLLLSGKFLESWDLYEWRWETKEISKFKRNFSQPLWLGDQTLSGKTILLHAEQGLGDTLQFCRYASMVAALGARVVLEVQRPLVRLLKDLAGVSSLIAKGDELPEFDFHCPLLSLPLAFKTDLGSIPCANSYLSAEPQRVAYWKDRLQGDAFKIGISWQGSHGTKIDIGRSFDLSLLHKIAALPNVQLVSLQKGYGSEQLKNLPQGMQVLDLGDALDADAAFLDTAAVMMNLDLVITCDTAIGHLAGALGVQVLVALKFVPDWRWLLDRADSPWYPSVRLYRQPSLGEWSAVFDQMKMDVTLNENKI